MHCHLLGLLALRQAAALGSAAEGDAVGLFQSRLSPHSLANVQSMPPMSLQHVDHSGMATKFQTFLQGSRFHRSFLFFNNLSAATGDFYAHTQSELNHLKSGFERQKFTQQTAAQKVAQFFAKEQQAVEVFLNITETKLHNFGEKLGSEDLTWVQSISDPIISHMKQLLDPMEGKVELMQSVADVATICSMAESVMSDLRTVDEMIREHAQPAFNKTSDLLPGLTTSSKGRLKMLRRFADQGYSILEKMRSIVVMPLGTLPTLLANNVQCGNPAPEATAEASGQGNTSNVTGQQIKEAGTSQAEAQPAAPPQEAPKPAASPAPKQEKPAAPPQEAPKPTASQPEPEQAQPAAPPQEAPKPAALQPEPEQAQPAAPPQEAPKPAALQPEPEQAQPAAPPQEAPKPAASQPEPEEAPESPAATSAESSKPTEPPTEKAAAPAAPSSPSASVAPEAASEEHSLAAGLAPGFLAVLVLLAAPHL